MPKQKKEVSDVVEDIKTGVEERGSNRNQTQNFIPSGSTLIDLVCGGGYGVGKMLNLVGDKSSGKSLLVAEMIFHARKKIKNLKWFYDDAESGFSFDTMTMYGYEMYPEEQKNSTTIEEFAHNLSKELDNIKKDETLIYIVDSFDGLSSEAEMKRMKERNKAIEEGKDYEKGTYAMEKQKTASELFRTLNQKIKTKNCLLVIVSQVRMNIGVMFGEKYVRSGGKALDFYASQINWLAEVEKKKKKDIVVGTTVKIKNKKNKLGKPFRDCFIDILFDYGIDNITSNLYYLYELRTPQGKSKPKKIEWDGQTYTPAALVKHIESNELEGELEKRVIEKWNSLEAEVSSSDRKRKF